MTAGNEQRQAGSYFGHAFLMVRRYRKEDPASIRSYPGRPPAGLRKVNYPYGHDMSNGKRKIDLIRTMRDDAGEIS